MNLSKQDFLIERKGKRMGNLSFLPDKLSLR